MRLLELLVQIDEVPQLLFDALGRLELVLAAGVGHELLKGISRCELAGGVTHNESDNFDRDKRTPLHLACIDGDISLSKTLISNCSGASLDLKDRCGNEPMKYAIMIDLRVF